MKSTKAPKPRKVTAACIRRVEEQFRAFVIALPQGATLEWFDMDLWVYANFREFWLEDGEYENDRDPVVAVMTLAERLELAGWLAYRSPCTRDKGDDYFRTDKRH